MFYLVDGSSVQLYNRLPLMSQRVGRHGHVHALASVTVRRHHAAEVPSDIRILAATSSCWPPTRSCPAKRRGHRVEPYICHHGVIEAERGDASNVSIGVDHGTS
jgi:hypothetical protein